MSKVTKRKITVETSATKHSSSSNSGSTATNNSNKESQRRQSVFERLGTKTNTSISVNTTTSVQSSTTSETFCRHWAQNGTCSYGKSCVFASTHTLISPSKRATKKETDTKQVVSRVVEDSANSSAASKRLHSTVVKRGSPELGVNWESWDQTDLEYEDEKVLEKRRQLLQRELELQMKREETEEHRHTSSRKPRPRHTGGTKDRKGVSSSSSTSMSSTSSTESSSSSDESSSGTSSSSAGGGGGGGGVDAKCRKNKGKKLKRRSTSSASDNDRHSKKSRDVSKGTHKDNSPNVINKKTSSGGRDKKPLTPPRKSSSSVSKMAVRKKSPSPSHRRHPATPPPAKNKQTISKSSSSGTRHNQSPRLSNKRSASVERKDKHNRSNSPRSLARERDRDRDRDKDRTSKVAVKDRSPPRRPDPPRPSRRKESPDNKSRSDSKRGSRKNSPKDSRSRPLDSRNDDRKKDDDRSRTSKDDRRTDRKPTTDRDKREHDDARSREKAREAAREKERMEALERCRERQREREQLAKEKERARERAREDREKETVKQREYEKDIPSLMSITMHNPSERKNNDRDRDRPINKDRDKERDRERDRTYDRVLDKNDRNRLPEKERTVEKPSDRDRAGDKDRSRDRERDRDHIDRDRNKPERDRSFDRDRGYDRAGGDRGDRVFDREKDRSSKVIDRNRDRDREFEREKDRVYERTNERARSFERASERDRSSLEKDRGVVRDRGLERVLERERNKSLERGRGSDSERSVERGRERFERDARFEGRRPPLPPDDKGYDSPYESRRDRGRYPAETSERVLYKDLSPSREEARNLRIQQPFPEERRGRSTREVPPVRPPWDSRSGYEDPASSKVRDWDFADSRREWDSRTRRGVEDWEGTAGHGIVEADDWSHYPPSSDWGASSDWREEWPARPISSRHPHRDDQAAGHIVPSNHIVVRDANMDDHGHENRRPVEALEKDAHAGLDFKKDTSDTGSAGGDAQGLKRPHDSDTPQEAKKPRMEEPVTTNILEEALSDISDDADDILNREDEVPLQEATTSDEDAKSLSQQNISQPHAQDSLDQRLLEDRAVEEEGIDNLDFEEISDEELEEEARANKGLGDALGVDWASLVAETRPRGKAEGEAIPGAAKKRWEPYNLLARIGVSLQYAGADVYNEIQQKISEKSAAEGGETEGEQKEGASAGLLHPVAALHVALREKQAKRRLLFCGKRAISARRDIAIRSTGESTGVDQSYKGDNCVVCLWPVSKYSRLLDCVNGLFRLNTFVLNSEQY